MPRKAATAVRLCLYLVAFVGLVRVFVPETPSDDSDPDGPFFWLIESTTVLVSVGFAIGLTALIVEATIRLTRRGLSP